MGSKFSRRDLLQATSAAALAGVGKQAAAQAAKPSPKRRLAPRPQVARPNIVYLHSHDSGQYCQPYGHDIPTPNLQRLADEGVLFRQAFSQAPTCSPSRAALLTGQAAHNAGMLGLAHRGWSLHDYRQVMIHTLHAAGYRSILAGVQHIARDPAMIGYDLILPFPAPQPNDPRHMTELARNVAARAVNFLAGRPSQPLFLYLVFRETHRPSSVNRSDTEPVNVDPPTPIPDAPETRRDMADYIASARDMDAGVGLVLDALDEYGLADDTIVISTTDHGIAFPDMKCSLRDDGWRVSMIIRGPGFPVGMTCDAMISQIDLFPTLCDLLGLDRPDWLQGRSFLPVVAGEAAEINEEVFAEVSFHAAYEPKRAVRTKRWKYIRRFDDRTTPVLPNCDDGPSKSYWLANGWRSVPIAEPEALYDLVFDPAERNNLAREPAHRATMKDKRNRLERWMKRTDDPLLKSPIPLPAGYITTSPDAVSPDEIENPAGGGAEPEHRE
jgi:arylsulfatase A-like enzyme